MFLYNRRSDIQVIADILRINGSKTAIMYGANLSYAQTQKYLDMLVHCGLLQCIIGEDGRRQHYVTSEKGQALLRLIDGLETFVGALDKPKAAVA